MTFDGLWRSAGVRESVLVELTRGFGWVERGAEIANRATVFAVEDRPSCDLAWAFRRSFGVFEDVFAVASVSVSACLVRAPRWTFLPLSRLARSGSPFWLSDPLPADVPVSTSEDLVRVLEGVRVLWCPQDEGSPLADFVEAARSAAAL